jgi:predicted dehydrogenase/threonine dehydrogenase-like Zn-dependent dehydrogenase
MKQLLQRLDNGVTQLEEIPVPASGKGQVVIETRATLISTGTERMLVEFGRSSLLDKARSQPDKVRQVLEKVRTEGLGPTMEAVRAKLEQPIPLGYCNAGVVVEAGAGAGFAPGERVVSNGSHAEYVRVPRTLVARIPAGVSFEHAAFTPVAAIGLQGLRLAQPTLGETVVVFGLGLIGLLTVQMARAHGCRVIGIDRDAERLKLAEGFGATALKGGTGDVVAQVLALTDGVGADIVLLTLASDSDEPVLRAAEMARKRGRLVLVGVTGLSLSRDAFYKKELSFQVSCSYGPGRYDPAYEDQGQDYPLPFVRWTEQRNFEAVLALMAEGRLDPAPLISHRFDFAEAPRAYDLLSGGTPSLGVVLRYPDRGGAAPTVAQRSVQRAEARPGRAYCTVGMIGAGNFATRVLLPSLRQAGARLHTIASSGGVSGGVAGSKFGFERVTTDLDAFFAEPAIDSVFVLTRHDTHANFAIRALEAGKHVFVEKPLALTEEELDRVEAAAITSGRIVSVGFNRRFAPLTTEVQGHLAERAGPVSLILTMNAGSIPRESWVHDPAIGGGRIVGEACHLLDLARVLVGARITEVQVTVARDRQGRPVDDIAHLAVAFADGSTAVVHYLANGSKAFAKERIECFWDGRVVTIDNWRRLLRFGVPGPFFNFPRRMDKGWDAEMRSWVGGVAGGIPPIPHDELFEVSRWAIKAAAQARV